MLLGLYIVPKTPNPDPQALKGGGGYTTTHPMLLGLLIVPRMPSSKPKSSCPKVCKPKSHKLPLSPKIAHPI